MGIQDFQAKPQKLRKRMQISIVANFIQNYFLFGLPRSDKQQLLINNDTISPDIVEEEEDEEEDKEDAKRMPVCLWNSV